MHSIVILQKDHSRSVYKMDEAGVVLQGSCGEHLEFHSSAAIDLALTILIDFAQTPVLADHAAEIEFLGEVIWATRKQAA